ncbi:MAG TPA: response regulator [Ornithinimicrobium sp.]|uniref:response regulator n=1 Tax=Ornithinimicrobium sp. TaxID=1977084 RepID=UPI002B47309B|nr:response regulator [Ornithinimicrobium sp.]HKJ11378.1 response regulator [Ornithinimicrobium sp.]
MSEHTDPSATGPAVQRIYERYRGVFDQQYADIEAAVMAASAADLDAEGAEGARRQAHKLAGAGGTFGLPRVTEAAREMEELFSRMHVGERVEPERLRTLGAELRSALDEGPQAVAPAPATADSGVDGPVLLLVSDDNGFIGQVRREAAERGLRVEARATQDDLDLEPVPDVALVAADGDPEGLQRVMSSLTTGPTVVPTIVLTPPDGQVDRVEVARWGGRGFLNLPVEARRALDAAQELLEAQRLEGIRILAVDDDPAVLEVVSSLLNAEGVSVTTLSDPTRFWEVLQQVAPDQLILDVDMPEVSGVALCRAVRSDPRWSQTSVLFLTAVTDSNIVEEVFAAGADDYVTKPINHRELVMRISNRLERFRLYRRLAETDPLTGAANRRKAMETLDRLRGAADRYDEALSLAVLDLDHFKAVNDEHGHLAGDEVLRSLGARLRAAFRGQDLVARWGGEEFLVAMYGMRCADAVHRVAEVLEAQRAVVHRDARGAGFRTTFSAGVAQYRRDGDEIQTLFRAADDALYVAKERGRDRVLPAGSDDSPGDDGLRDVVVVEDDQALASLLAEAIHTRGWTTERISDGDHAAAALAGDPPRLRARLVLLGWDLPGLNGPEVLARLADAGILRDTQVIMLTSHVSDRDIGRTHRLGAIDHIAKPVSVPVLMQRMRSALDR